MDERRTQQTLDALADLFLTGTDAADADAPGEPPDALDSPDPIRLPPKVRTNSAVRPPRTTPPLNHRDTQEDSTPPPSSPASDAPPPTFKLHPAARAIDDDAPPRDSSADDRAWSAPDAADVGSGSARLTVEAVVMANLPGFSGPWLTQYAARLAREAGPVLVLHLEDAAINAELVSPHADPAPTLAAGPTDSLELLIDALETLDPPLATVLVHGVTHDARQRLVRTAGLGRWVVLTGADDAALASCTELIRSIDRAEAETELGLMVMGSDASSASAAVRRVNEQGGASRRRVELVGAQKQMAPVRQHVLGRFADLEEAWRVVEAIISATPMVRGRDDEPMAWSAQRGTRPAGEQAVPEHEAPIEGESSDDPPMRDEPMRPGDRDVIRSAARDFVDRLDEPTPPTFPPTAQSTQPTQPAEPELDTPPEPEPEPAAPSASAAPADSDPQPTPEPDSDPDPAPPAQGGDGQTESERDVTLASFLPGGIALQATCPRQPAAQLGLDEAGRLHLMRRHRKDHEPLRSAIMDLIEARSWVAEHLELLSMTQRQCRFDLDASPTIHLFTDDAASAAGLVNRLSDEVQLHLLSEMRVGEAIAWYHARLT